ncbi:MAG: gamma-glutamylcyclotransferase [Wenzhouxiangellaceae bacterium]|nr:MAG: gamma-glutamylcyclotransferase [Wenzhouxiangellaceae bacterium]
MKKSSVHYLAYGSNLHPARLEARLGPVTCLGKVALPGWRLCFDKRGSDGSAKANLRAAPGTGQVAWGAVFRLNRAQYAELDRFEGAGRGYETFWLDLMLAGREQAALTYLSPSHWLTDNTQPYDWYRDLVLAGARYHEFPKDYCAAIARIPAVEDSDTKRAARQNSLLGSTGCAGRGDREEDEKQARKP